MEMDELRLFEKAMAAAKDAADAMHLAQSEALAKPEELVRFD